MNMVYGKYIALKAKDFITLRPLRFPLRTLRLNSTHHNMKAVRH